MFIRLMVIVISLYALGDPAFDQYRPEEMTAVTHTVRQVLEPSVNQAGLMLQEYLTPDTRTGQAYKENPLVALRRGLER